MTIYYVENVLLFIKQKCPSNTYWRVMNDILASVKFFENLNSHACTKKHERDHLIRKFSKMLKKNETKFKKFGPPMIF